MAFNFYNDPGLQHFFEKLTALTKVFEGGIRWQIKKKRAAGNTCGRIFAIKVANRFSSLKHYQKQQKKCGGAEKGLLLHISKKRPYGD